MFFADFWEYSQCHIGFPTKFITVYNKTFSQCSMNSINTLKDLNQKEFYHWLKETGIGFTPLARLPKQINPFDDHIKHLRQNLNNTNFAESIKARAFATMYYLNKVSGRNEQ